MAVNWSLQHKRDTAANWTANNPTLLAGQIGIETDNLTTTPKFKIGDGVTAWNTLPYFYGGSLSAQDLSNVLGVGNTTSGNTIVLTDDDKLQIGSTANRYISYDTNLIQIGLGIVNLNSNDHIVLQDSGGIHIDTTYVQLPQLTASRVIATDASNKLSALTGTGLLSLNAGVISYDTNTYLTTSAAALAYQPLDSDLTSWAGVTRASGFDTFAATPSSANLASLVTDETGSGALVFGTSPTFTTDITTPLIIGGSAVGSAIQYKGTSGVGTSTVSAHQFLVGNNGATTAAQIFNSGQVSIGNYASPTNLRALTIGQDTAYMSFGSLVGATTDSAIYLNTATPSLSNYSISGDGTNLLINAPSAAGTITLRAGNNNRYIFNTNNIQFLPTASTSGAVTNFTFTKPNNTGQTASTAINGVLWTLGSRQWATGAITTQKEFELTSPTYSFVGASTITEAITFSATAPTAGTNATITTPFAAALYAGTASLKLGNVSSTSDRFALYINQGTPSSTNYAISCTASSGTITDLNGSAGTRIRVAGTDRIAVDTSQVTFSTATNSGNAFSAFIYSPANNNNQTLSTEIPGYLYNSYTRTWAAGAITTQRERYYKTVTYAFASASTITNAYGAYFESPTAGANATITNNYAVGLNGNLSFASSNGTVNSEIGDLRLTATSGNRIQFFIAGTERFRVEGSNILFNIGSGGTVTFGDGNNMVFNATTGTKFGTATTQKLAFWNATPIVQPTTAVAAATFAANTSGIANDTATFDGYTIGQVVKALRNIGLLA